MWAYISPARLPGIARLSFKLQEIESTRCLLPLMISPQLQPYCTKHAPFCLFLQEFRCYNGTCFSPDGRTMYATETPLQKMYRYDYDCDTGDISNKRLFVQIEVSGVEI